MLENGRLVGWVIGWLLWMLAKQLERGNKKSEVR